MRKLIIALLLTLTARAYAGDKPLATVTLELRPAKILPGVPFDLLVHYKNESNQTIAVGKYAIVIIRPTGGEATRMPRSAEIRDFSPRPNFVVLQPGEEATGDIAWDNNFFYDDAQFTDPGTYDISLELYGSLDDPDEGVADAGRVLTSAVRLMRINPEGEDAEVWRRLQEASGGKCPSKGFGSVREGVGNEIIANHPHSNYYPYALLLRGDNRIDLGKLRGAIDRFRDSPAYPRLLGAASRACDQAAVKAEQSNKPLDEIESYYKLSLFYMDEQLHVADPVTKAGLLLTRRDTERELERVRSKRAQLK